MHVQREPPRNEELREGLSFVLNPTNLSATLCWLGYEFEVEGGVGYQVPEPPLGCCGRSSQFEGQHVPG